MNWRRSSNNHFTKPTKWNKMVKNSILKFYNPYFEQRNKIQNSFLKFLTLLLCILLSILCVSLSVCQSFSLSCSLSPSLSLCVCVCVRVRDKETSRKRGFLNEYHVKWVSRDIRLNKTGVTDSCDQPVLGPRNKNQVFYKSQEWFWLLSYLSSPSVKLLFS